MGGSCQFSQSERKVIDKQEGKARVNLVGWSQRHQCELMLSYTQRQVDITELQLCVLYID